MNEKQLNDELRRTAIRNGLCEQWQGYWKKDWSLQKMAERFFTGIDFYLKNRFVTNDMFKSCFDKSFLRENGILVDDEYSLLNPTKAIAIGKSKSTIRYNSNNVASLYIVDESEVKIVAKGNSFVIVHLLDSTRATISQEGKAEVIAIIHSPSAKVYTDDTITIKYELDYLKG